MSKKKKNKKQEQQVIEQVDEFLLSTRMGLSKSTIPIKLNPDETYNGDTRYFDSAYGGWYKNFEFKKNK